MVGAVNEGSERLFNFPAAKTTGADADAPGRSIDHGADTLKVGIERAFGLVVGVTDVVPGLMLFRTDITYECHGLTPYWEV